MANYTWLGNSGAINLAANWNNDTDGLSNDGFPMSDDLAIFSGASTISGNATIGYVVVVSAITFTGQLTAVGQFSGATGPVLTAFNVGGGGVATFTGAGASLTSQKDAIIGGNSDGGLVISGGATAAFHTASDVAESGLYIAYDAGTVASTLIDGTGTTVTSDSGVTVGVYGTGDFAVSDNASVTLQDLNGFGFYIGYDSTGNTFELNTGASLQTDGFIDIGADAGSSGVATIDGMGTTLTVGQDISVGFDGAGTLIDQNQASIMADTLASGDGTGSVGNTTTVDTGATIVVQSLRLAIGDMSDATLTVDGAGSMPTMLPTVTVHQDASVGEAGDGHVMIQAGGQVTVDGTFIVAELEGSTGDLTVTGWDDADQTASTLTINLAVDIGLGGVGDATVSDGGSIDAAAAQFFDLGTNDGSQGTLTVTGQSGSDQASSVDTSDMFIGYSGDATVNVEDHGGVTSTSVTLGVSDGASGTANMNGAPAGESGDATSWDISGGLVVGAGGDGVFNVQVADLSVGGAVIVGRDATGNGSLSIFGSSPDFSGDMTIGQSGDGLVSASGGTTFTVMALDLGVNADSTGELDADGVGTAIQSDNATIGDMGQGTLKLTNGATLTNVTDATIGASVGGAGTVNVGGGAMWLMNGGLTVGGSGTAQLNLTSGGEVSALGNVSIADAAGAIANVALDGSSQSKAHATSLGWGQTLIVGNGGAGVLDVTNAAFVAPTPNGVGAVEIGAQAMSSGMLTVDGAQSELDASTISIGGVAGAEGGTGVLTASNGGLVSVGGAAPTIELWSGGEIVTDPSGQQTGTILIGSGPATAGTLTISANASLVGDGEVDGAIVNDGLIEAIAAGATPQALILSDAVSGTGHVLIADGGSATFDGAFNENVAFQGAGGLALSQNYAGVVSGAGAGDSIDLSGVGYAAGERMVFQSATNGVQTFALESASNTVLATFNFAGPYAAGYFSVTADAENDALISLLRGSNASNPDDFNGDGLSDLLLENASGAVVTGEVVSGAESYAQVAALGPEWSFEGNGDFLGDGNEDFLIENTSGAVDVGEISNGTTTYTQVAALGPEWQFVGTGDFLGNGQDQFLIENSSGAVVVGNVVDGQAQYSLISALGPEWSFEGTGNFLGDGATGFLIENTSGAVDVGEVSNGTTTYTQVAALGPEWRFVGTGDFLNNGQDQFLIENSSGALDIANVVGGQAQYAQIGALGPEWSFIGTGDYVGAGTASFMIENTSGAVVLGTISNGQAQYALVGALGPEWTSYSHK